MRKLKRKNYRRIRSWIPKTSGGVIMIASKLQMVRTYGTPSELDMDSAKLWTQQYSVGPLLYMRRLSDEYSGNRWIMTETDFSTVVPNDGTSHA